jgi:hypothetical protein
LDVAKATPRLAPIEVSDVEVGNRRRKSRISVAMTAHIQRSDGSVIAAQCVDANDEVFAVHTPTPFRVGELVRLTLGRTHEGPTFVAHVIWYRNDRVGLRCNASAD